MENQVEILNPEQFGLEKTKGKSVELAFAPMTSETEQLTILYDQLMKKEVTEELIDEATDLGKKLMKNRTGIASIHTKEKAFSLAYGKFIDAWKNKSTEPILQMEQGVKKIKTHFENIETVRVQKITDLRTEELKKFGETDIPKDLGYMPDNIWTNFIAGAKVNFEKKQEEEKKAEEERLKTAKLQKTYDERFKEMLPYTDYLDITKLTLETTFEEYSNTLNLAIKSKTHAINKAKEQEKENKKLKAEKIESDKKAEEIRLAEKKKADEKDEEQAKILAKTQKEKQDVQDKLDAIAKQKADDLENELNKGDEEKIQDLIDKLNDIKDNTTFKSKKNLVMWANTQGLITKVVDYIKK